MKQSWVTIVMSHIRTNIIILRNYLEVTPGIHGGKASFMQKTTLSLLFSRGILELLVQTIWILVCPPL
jgi:hypothetical protein